MTKSTKIWIIVSLVVLAIAVGIIGVCNWFFSPGIHVVGPAAHLDAEKKCYYIDYKTGEIIGESVLKVDCDINVSTKVFKGTIELPEYPVKGIVPGNPSMRMHEGYIALNYVGIQWTSEETGEVDPFVDTGYFLYVKDADHLFAVTNFRDGMVLVVCADNEQQAKELSRTLHYLYWGIEPQNW